MKLNLGCGRLAFPLDRATVESIPYYENHLYPLPDTVFEPGWVNIDHYHLDGVNEVIDLFRFPFVRSTNGNPFNDGTIDEFYISHLIEHIPHRVEVAGKIPFNWQRRYAEMIERMDGFFLFFAEIYRLAKPDALVYIRCPFANSVPALADPSHTRYIVPGTFGYLVDHNPEAPFDYQLPMNFELASTVSLRWTPQWAGRVKTLADDEIHTIPFRYNDAVDELRITLRAVKE